MISYLAYRAAAGGYSFVNSEAEAVVAAFSTEPDDTRKELIDDTVGALKTAGVWTKLYFLHVMAANAELNALVNWKSPGTFNLVRVNSPTFTTDRGFTGDAVSMHLTIGAESTVFPNGSRDDEHLGAWQLTSGTNGEPCLANVSTGDKHRLFVNGGANERQVRVSGSTEAIFNDNITTGHVVGRRPDSANVYSYRNGTDEQTGAIASSAPTANSLALLRRNTGYNAAQIFACHGGQNLSATEVTALYDALNAYKTGVGA
ncbi:MAG: hypothetical protein WD036_10255 [Bauldia sp.]